ncbi:hypothetical protein EMIT07CA2_260007 [Brevibacillus sp. IT-7CA2]
MFSLDQTPLPVKTVQLEERLQNVLSPLLSNNWLDVANLISWMKGGTYGVSLFIFLTKGNYLQMKKGQTTA